MKGNYVKMKPERVGGGEGRRQEIKKVRKKEDASKKKYDS